VGVSLSCGSLWFIDAGQVAFIDAPVSPRFLSQDDRRTSTWPGSRHPRQGRPAAQAQDSFRHGT
jgi:hypothetical protein